MFAAARGSRWARTMAIVWGCSELSCWATWSGSTLARKSNGGLTIVAWTLSRSVMPRDSPNASMNRSSAYCEPPWRSLICAEQGAVGVAEDLVADVRR